MKPSTNPAMTDVAIVGAGFSGTMVATHLLLSAAPRLPRGITLIDRRRAFARGVAYSTMCPLHLLNVPAGNMSALPHDAEHFLTWLRARDPAATAATFAPRAAYGVYLEELLAHAAACAAAHCALHQETDEAVNVERAAADTFELTLRSGRRLATRHVVLALGNSPPRPLQEIDAELRGDPRVQVDPWAEAAPAAPNARVLILGSGLTMVDQVLALRAAGHRGQIVALSRRGWLPTVHRAGVVRRAWLDRPLPITVCALVRELRRTVRGELAAGGDWRGVIDGMRSVTPELWRGWSRSERARFLRHARALWDVHRHRMAPEIATRVQAEIASGGLVTRAGRLLRLAARGEALHAQIRLRGERRVDELTVERFVNCSGPETDHRRVVDPLVAGLLARGLLRLDPLELGFEATGDGVLLDADGRSMHRLWALGPPTRGRWWEGTAVPELRVQAADVAAAIAADAPWQTPVHAGARPPSETA